MKTSSPLTLTSLLLLSACAQQQSSVALANIEPADYLQNPLYAEAYYDALVENMVNITVENGPLAKDPRTKDIMDKFRTNGQEFADKAELKQEEGLHGFIQSDNEHTKGEVLVLDGMLYIGPFFEIEPGPDVHVYLTEEVLATNETFPDASAMDLGTVKTMVGAQQYTIDPAKALKAPRTVVFFDRRLKDVYGFAQLN